MTRSAYRLTIGAIAAAAFGICYFGVIASLIDVWSTNYLYSYGIAVPLIAAFIFWTKSHESQMQVGPPDYVLGVPVTLAGIAMLMTGRLGALITLEQASLVVTLAGLLLLLFGRDAVRPHWFAVAYLLLMVPIWGYPIEHLQDPSRLLSTKIAVNMLRSIGVPVLRQGTNILLPSHALAVLRECSGVNQLIALTAMVLPAAYLWLDTTARRVALLFFAVVISYLGNGLRIALVGWLAVKGLGDGDINGSYHLLQGLSVSVLGYLAIGGCFSLLSTSKQAAPPGLEEAAPTLPPVSSPLPQRRVWLDVAVLCVMLGAGASRLSATSLDVQLSPDLRSLADQIDDWTMDTSIQVPAVNFPGIDDDLVDVGEYPSATGARRFAAVDDELVRAYKNPSGARVQLYIGYYRHQDQAKELAGDASSALAAAASSLALKTDSGTLELKEVAAQKAGSRHGVLFWYDINGRIVSDLYDAKGYTIWDAATRRRTNGAVVMIAWEGPAGVESEAAREHAIEFARVLMPILRRHLPS
jgi:EpsI family protein